MKKVIMFATVLLILWGCGSSINDSDLNATVSVNVPDLSEDIFASGPFLCNTNWSNSAVHQEILGRISNWRKDFWRYKSDEKAAKSTKCIENQETSECFLLYAMYNNLTNLCEYYPEETVTDVFFPPSAARGVGGGHRNITCPSRDICYLVVESFNHKK